MCLFFTKNEETWPIVLSNVSVGCVMLANIVVGCVKLATVAAGCGCAM